MRTRNVRSRQWRKHYRVVRALDRRAFRQNFEAISSGAKLSPSGVSIVINDGLIHHSNKLALRGKGFWLP